MIRFVIGMLFIVLIGFSFSKAQSARAYMINSQGESIGEVDFSQTDSGVIINVNLSNLAPGAHAFHIHETGACQLPDFKSAGGHFNPEKKEHGLLNPKGPHAGDLPNIYVDSSGKVNCTLISKLISLKKGTKNSILNPDGTAIAIHQNPDNYISQPSGAGGPILACGVIVDTSEKKNK